MAPLNLEKAFQDAAAAFEAGEFSRAERLLKKLDREAPGEPAVLHLRGLVALRDKKPKIAVKHLKQAVALAPTPDRLNALGSAYSQSEAYGDAIEILGRAVKQSPGDAATHFNLANALRHSGNPEASLPHYRAAVEIAPGFADAYYNLGLALAALWRFEDAVRAYDRCLAINPNDAEALKNKGNAFHSAGQTDQAVEQLEKACALAPGDADGFYNLANALKTAGEFDRAFEAFGKALALNPGEKSYTANFSALLKDLGEVDLAIERLQATDKGGGFSPIAHSNLLFCMCYSPDHDAGAILKEAKRWNKTHALPLAAKAVSHANAPDPDRPLKVGYLTGDLRTHPVGFFMEPVFENHDKTAFEIHVYATNRRADGVTGRIKGHVDQWHDAAALDPQGLADAVRDEGMDILVDLAGHTADNRLLTLARRPAPVQILGGGHFCTSGLDCIDGLLSDRFETPEGTDGLYSEPLIRLPDDYVCYRPPDYAAGVGPSPCLENGFITFGCFNNLAKVSGPAVALWADILGRAPDSRLLLKTAALGSARARDRLRSLFGDHGVSEDRLELEPGLAHEPFMAEYGRVDIGLDPFPYSGGLTTIEALWMGVPVVALAGETFAARHSTSHLMNAGLDDLICGEPTAYVDRALDLAADFDALNALRQSLRPALAASPILDGEKFTRNLEKVFRTLWQNWCEQTSS